jgi:3-oxoacyl-[acyl-carrier protein] reductase
MTRHVLITGGGTGLGRAMAARFAAAGDTVIITGRREAQLKATAAQLDGNVTAIRCDHTNVDQIQSLAAQLPERLDVLINNAGGNTDIGAAAPTDLAGIAAAWQANLDANLLSAVLTSEALADRIADGGSVIQLGSIAADKGNGAYGAAKAGLASWNIGLAQRLGARGVTSNVLSPGYTADTEFFGDSLTPQRHEAKVEATVVKRAGTPDDIAEAAWFLASPGARNITAQVLKVDGGSNPSR